MNTSIRTAITQTTPERSEIHSFGMDAHGREVGVRISFAVHVFERVTDGSIRQDHYHHPEGTYYSWHAQAIRDGKKYGAGQTWTYCNTEAARVAQVARYLERARKRAEQQTAAPASADRKPTVSVQWLEAAAIKLDADADASLPAWIILGQAHRYCEDVGKARALRQAAEIKSISARREFLRAIGIGA